jgi:CDP-4-dehydro-6-deoxyglucose reductase
MPKVTLVPTGQEFNAPSGETVLTAALRAGLNLPHSCKGGHCGSCRARLLGGRVEYPAPPPVGITAQELRDGYALLCQARPLDDLRIETREVRPAPDVEIRSLPCRVERLTPLAADVMRVELRLPAVEPFRYLPGQYVDVMLADGRRRSFSMANAPLSEPRIELHVRRASGTGFTAEVFETLRPGALLRIEGPLGQFCLHPDSPRPSLMIAGGTGYAPLRAMLQLLIERGDRRRVRFYWGARSRADLYEDAWLRATRLTHPHFEYEPVLSEPSAVDAPCRQGWVHEAVLADVPRLEEFDVYAAGPPAMIGAIRRTFVARGLPASQLFFDSFDYAPDTLERMRSA